MRRIIAAAMAFATIAMVQRLFAMVFVLNFDVAGPNATAAMAALLITAPAWRVVPGAARPALAGLAFAAILAASFLTGAVAAAGAAVALLAMAPLWRSMGQASVDGAVVGALAWMTVTAWLGGVSPFHVGPWLVPALALPLLGWLRLEAATTPAPAALWAFMAVQATWLAALPSLWRWSDVSPVGIAIASAGGLALGLWTRTQRWHPALAPTLFVVAAAMTLNPWWPAGAVFLAQVAAVRLLGEGGGIGRLAVVQTLAVVFLFLHVVAGNWAFVGFVPEALSRGLAGVYMFLLLALLPLAAWRRA